MNVSNGVENAFHGNLLSARFVFGFRLCLVLIPFSVLLGIGGYREQLG
jgi:hypothetical protein